MGEMIEFAGNGATAKGYLAVPASGSGPGVVVIQEWWGLVDHIKDVCDRFAAEGFVALGPDLYHGETTTEPDEAGKLMMDLEMARAARDMTGAAVALRERDEVDPKKVGCVGFCMGGALSLVMGTVAPVDAVVTFYGLPYKGEPDWSGLTAPVQGHFAESDDFFPPDKAKELFARLRDQGTSTDLHVYPGTQHAFFNDTRPEVHDAAASAAAFERTLGFLRSNLA